nr:MerR family DNA-binding transcriptional regulator [Chroococcidiopsis sp. CCMEE 29]
MLKIGDFSKLSHVTVKALRLYDQMGLLKPGWVDDFTGYRYYSAD